MPTALGIESSCDDCSVSVVRDNGELLFLAQKDQNQIHRAFGGVVPELASRDHENHILPLIDQALKVVPLKELDLLAFSNRPGLMGSLLVASTVVKTLSLVWDKALIGVNHIEAHIFSGLLFEKSASPVMPSTLAIPTNSVIPAKAGSPPVQFPALALIVSGGHSAIFYVKGAGDSLLLAQTRDDSAGEAFDKMARLLGFEWPGGPWIDKMAQKALKKQKFFSKIRTSDLSFSFSGIKSQARRLLEDKSKAWIEKNKEAICADYQEQIVSHLMEKLNQAFIAYPVQQILLGGGVSANSLLRQKIQQWAREKKRSCLIPQHKFCMDNGAMVALTGLKYFLKGYRDEISLACSPSHQEKDFFKRL